MFATVIYKLIKEAKKKATIKSEYWRMRETQLLESTFMDDKITIANSEENLQFNLNILNKVIGIDYYTRKPKACLLYTSRCV